MERLDGGSTTVAVVVNKRSGCCMDTTLTAVLEGLSQMDLWCSPEHFAHFLLQSAELCSLEKQQKQSFFLLKISFLSLASLTVKTHFGPLGALGDGVDEFVTDDLGMDKLPE
uniref:Uncharacterized protein n=1 Tax=Pristionchus pacificus TaxID=54126 RepID=A0A2A6CFD9_PRIPA|eukprot:PDM76912.1 hypothetical protein PRIPAC_42307 [Pristionchus pacificus]